MVSGPAKDRGWQWACAGTRALLPPFASLRWSSEHALADTLANVKANEVAMPRTLSDIDDGEAWSVTKWRELSNACSHI